MVVSLMVTKIAAVIPLIKKATLPADDLKNYQIG